jgi:hypothetical protein
MNTHKFRDLIEAMPPEGQRRMEKRLQETIAAMPLDQLRKRVDTSAIAGTDPVLLWGVDGEDLVVGKTSRTPTLMWVKP